MEVPVSNVPWIIVPIAAQITTASCVYLVFLWASLKHVCFAPFPTVNIAHSPTFVNTVIFPMLQHLIAFPA
jgi:hypothetical protein